MTHKIAVAVVHGIGKQKPNFASAHIKCLRRELEKELGHKYKPANFVFGSVYWQPCLQLNEDKLWARLKKGGELNLHLLRRFFIDFAADAVAYQPAQGSDQPYQDIHKIFATTLCNLAKKAGADAPLCIVAHSLGTVIASNYIWDIQSEFGRKNKIIKADVRAKMGDTPLERGDTLASFFTLGSPLAVWGLRFDDFGSPVTIPSPSFVTSFPDARGEWVNFYDRDDIIGYPLKGINKAYKKAVTADMKVSVGNILTGWNPASHVGYWDDKDVCRPIAKSLARLWREVNGATAV